MNQKLRFFMLALLCAVLNVAWGADTWKKTELSSLTTNDVFVIVGTNGGGSFALSNNNGTGSAPTAVLVTIENEALSGTITNNIQWNISGNATDGYTFYPNGTTETWLYCTNSNNGVRVGTNANKTFVIEDGYLKHSGTSRYVGIYNSQDWRCYTSNGGNIEGQTFSFYKKVESQDPVDPSVTISAETVEVGKTITISGPEGLTISFSSSDDDIATVDNDGVVTGVAEGEVTITASWGATDDYKSGSKEFTINVIAAIIPDVYEMVTNVNQLVAGNKYILVATENSMAMGKMGSNLRTNVNVTIEDNKVSITDEEVAVLTLGGSSGAWTFLASDNNEYLAYSGSSNQLHSNADDTEDASKWKVTSNFELESANVSGRVIQYNSQSPRFACYTSTQKTAVLFVLEGSQIDDKADPALAFSEESVSINIGDDFTAPTLTYAEGFDGTITYESSNTDVATVDQTGAVTIVNTGTTTITASFAGNDAYLPASASYTINVDNPNAPGKIKNPYTVAQARAAIDAGTGTSGVYATGIVSEIVTPYNAQYGNITYNISDDGTTTADQLQAYRGKSYNGDNFTSANDIKVGDVVVIFGNLTKYEDTYEFSSNSQLVSLVRSFPLPISSAATDGTSYFATMANIGNGNFIVPEDVTVSTVVVDDKGKIILNEVGPVIPGSKAYLVEASEAKEYKFFATTEEPSDVTLGLLEDNMLYPSVKDALTSIAPYGIGDDIDYTFYKLANGKKANSVGFYYGKEYGEPFESTKENGAFLAVPKDTYDPSASANPGVILINPDDDVDGIQGISTSELKNAEVYTLTGVRVQGNLQKGIYIVNGRKQVIK